MIPSKARPFSHDERHDYLLRRYDLADKYEKGKGLNFKERSNLSDVYTLGAEQTIECYGSCDIRGIGFTVAELQAYCSECPYARKDDRIQNNSVWFPHFVETYLKHMDMNDESYWFVYFVTDGQYVKIGKGSESNARITQLQTGNPRKITELFRIPTSTATEAYKLETFLHNAYREYRMCGEWFDIYGKLAVEAWKESWITRGTET